MLGIGETLNRLAAHRKEWRRMALSADGSRWQPSGEGRLTEIRGFGSNPGNLRMLVHAPHKLAEKPALVVVLHGCTQTAEGYDHGTGWSELADRHGFVVLFAEQDRSNNPNLCFNWFYPGDIRRDRGEPASIAQMIGHAISEFGVDHSRVFVTGLSAGGAMAAVMLAAYPELFAAGAIIAGLPYGTSQNVQEAFSSMADGREHTPEEWGDLVRAAAPRPARWPKISVWQGTADQTVNPVNAEQLVAQWVNVHRLSPGSFSKSTVEGFPRRVWSGAHGDMVEAIFIPGMGHGTPLSVLGPHAIGNPGPYLLNAGISSTWHIAQSWGLLKRESAEARPPSREAARVVPAEPIHLRAREDRAHQEMAGSASPGEMVQWDGVQADEAVIEAPRERQAAEASGTQPQFDGIDPIGEMGDEDSTDVVAPRARPASPTRHPTAYARDVITKALRSAGLMK